jgi:hypothetical protein
VKLTGKIIKNRRVIKISSVSEDSEDGSIRDKLEDMLIKICKDLDIQVPLWFDRNTREFGAFKKTRFTEEQFIEDIKFTSFEISLE